MTNGNIESTEANQNIYSMPPSPPLGSYEENPIPEQKGRIIKIIVGVLIGLIFVSVVGATIALYTRAWDPLWNPFRPEPDKVIQEMTQRMKNIKTMHAESEIGINAEDDYESMNILLTINSDADATNPENPKSAGEFNISFHLKPTGKYTTSSGEVTVSFSGEAKTIGQIFYLKIVAIPAMIADSLRSQTGIDLNELFAKKWIKIDPESISKSIQDLLENYSGTSMMAAIEGILEEQTENQKELQEKFKKMLEGKNFFIVKKELPDTTTNGIKMYHYVITLNKPEVKSLIPEFAIIYVDMVKEMMPPDFELTEEDIYQAKKEITDALNKAFDEFFVKVGDIDGEVFIGKKDYLLYEVKIEKLMDLSKINKYSKGTIAFNLDMDFSNFNKPVTIEAPAESTDILEIIVPIIQAYLEEAQKRAKDARIEANLNYARTIAEMIYAGSTSYENLCTEYSKKFNRAAPTYGTQLGQIEDDIESAQGWTLDLVCLDSATSYCIATRLASGGMYCIDSSGLGGEIQNNQTCIGNGTSYTPFKCPPRGTPIVP